MNTSASESPSASASIAVPIAQRARGAPLPAYASASAAGMDLRADLPTGTVTTLRPLERALIPTGIHIELPNGYEGQVRPRSGLALKNGITVLNAPGTIDADYRGEIRVLLVNLSDTPFDIHPGDRIAQLVVAKHERVVWERVDALATETPRSAGGFGHTGLA